MGCSSSSSTTVRDTELVVDDISDPTKVKAPIETDNGYGPGRQNKGQPALPPPVHRSSSIPKPAIAKTTTKPTGGKGDGVVATTAKDDNQGGIPDARSRYAMDEDPANTNNNNDDSLATATGAGGLPGLPGLGGLPSFQPRRYEDVHPPAPVGGGDEEDDDEPKPQGDQAVTGIPFDLRSLL
jgi:hypothetical protein